jgi:hypothetical protein
MRFRLLKYCCRIWDMSFRVHPEQRTLRAIVPLVERFVNSLQAIAVYAHVENML